MGTTFTKTRNRAFADGMALQYCREISVCGFEGCSGIVLKVYGRNGSWKEEGGRLETGREGMVKRIEHTGSGCNAWVRCYRRNSKAFMGVPSGERV